MLDFVYFNFNRVASVLLALIILLVTFVFGGVDLVVNRAMFFAVALVLIWFGDYFIEYEIQKGNRLIAKIPGYILVLAGWAIIIYPIIEYAIIALKG